MARNGAGKKPVKTQNFYDRIAEVHNLALRVNGYRASVAKYFRSLDLGITSDSIVLDAGSGTGIVTLGFADAGFTPKQTIAFDLSHKSLQVAAEQFAKRRRSPKHPFAAVQGNVLRLPFADDTFDIVLSCGVLEYVSLDGGLKELARVTRPGGKLVFIPVKPSLVGSVLQFLYKFKAHNKELVKKTAQKYFKLVGNHEFPLNEPISWSKTIFLLEKPSK